MNFSDDLSAKWERAAALQQQDFDDLQREVAGLEVGRIARFLPEDLRNPEQSEKRKAEQQAEIERGAEAILRSLQPARQVLDLALAMFGDVWNMRLLGAQSAKATLSAQVADVEGQIESLLDRIVNAANPSVIAAYEARIDKLERRKIMLAEQADKVIPPQGRMEEFIEHALVFLASPWSIYEKGGLALRRTVLKLAFAEPLRYSRETGYRTAENTFPFKVLADFSTPKCGMVEGAGFEPA